jgi:ATP phosphoribosyltransferase regulatory subunit
MATKFRYPTGARPLLVEETARRRRIEARFVEQLDDFDEIVLPIIDFAEPYAGVIDRDAARQSYRFVDRDGELVAIRSDFTPIVARALATSLSPADLPLRVFYRGDVIRCEATRLGRNREMFQMGAEIIGDASAAADVEVLRLARTIARAFGAKPLVVWNDVSIVDRFDAATREALLTKRRTSTLPPLAQQLLDGTATIADVQEFDPAAAARLTEIDAALDSDEFVLHLDDVDAAHGYYTGLRFSVFGTDGRTRIAQGGRYDELYARFGTAAPAVGFTFTIDDLEVPDAECQEPASLRTSQPQREAGTRNPAPGTAPEVP